MGRCKRPGSLKSLPRYALSYQSRFPLALHPQFPQGSPQPSLVAQRVKRPPAMREACVRSLGREDPLEKPGKSQGQGSLAQSMWSQRVRHDWATSPSLPPQGVAVVHGCPMVGILSSLNSLRDTSSLWRAAISDDCDSLIHWYGRKYSISRTNTTSLKLNMQKEDKSEHFEWINGHESE